MQISVFGLGYVGAVSGACLAELGHHVVGVDVDPGKVASINTGESPIVEELIAELTRDMAQAGRLRATADAADAVAATDMSLVCVGTPSREDGGLDSQYVRRVCEEIGAALAAKSSYHVVVIRSTVLPGAVHGVAIPALEAASGKQAGQDFGVCFHPEFLREGSSVRDFREPPKIVIGADDARAAEVLASIYEGFDAPLVRTAIGAAEMVKYADNAFHALKVVFGNEVGTLCKELGIDSHAVMDIFCMDTKLNISPTYLKPGFAYGGSCLPKDLRALMHLARTRHVAVPMLDSLQPSNAGHTQRGAALALASGAKRIAMLGLSFKRGTDDLRESPLVEMAETLLGKGIDLRIYDENVLLSRLQGGNKAYIEARLPHISRLLVDDIAAALDGAETVVVGAKNPAFAEALAAHGAGKVVVDLVRLFDEAPPNAAAYHGICW